MGNQIQSTSTDDIFDALADVHRRRVLVSLLDHNPQSVEPLSGASRDMFEMNTGLLDEFLSDSQDITGTDKPAIRLYHIHLPKLAAAGFIEWDREANKVEKGPQFEEIRPLLELMEEHRETLPDGWL